MTTTIDTRGLDAALSTPIPVAGTTSAAAVLENLKNSAKIQLAIAYVFHEKAKITDSITIDLVAKTLTWGAKNINLSDDLLTLTKPINTAYDSRKAQIDAMTTADGNFYDGFFSMFDGKATSAPAKKPTTKKSRKVKK
jgi:hypothetical protein